MSTNQSTVDEDFNVADAILQIAAGRSDLTALESETCSMTYGELREAVLRGQIVLDQLGVRCGDRVGLVFRDSMRQVVLMLACARLGATFAPIDSRLSREEQRTLLDLFEIDAIFTDDASGEHGTFLTDDPPWWQQADLVEEPPSSGGKAALVITLSSGTTGVPMGAVVSHASCYHRLAYTRDMVQHDSPLRVLSVVPLSFSAGWSQLLFHLSEGSTVVFYPPLFRAQELIEVVEKKRIDCLYLVPTMLRDLLELPERADPVLNRVQFLFSGGAPLSVEEKLAISRKVCPRHYHRFGASGVGGISVLRPEDLDEHAESAGRVNSRLEFRILDEQHRPVAPGHEGVLAFRGPAVAREFIGANPPLDPAGWCHTGDVAEVTSDGFLFLKGRESDFINRGGVNVYSGLVEEQLKKLADVREAAVVGRPSEKLGEEIVAFVVVQNGLPLSELQAFARSRMSGTMRPSEIIIKQSLPKTSSGKIRKGVLRQALMKPELVPQ